MRFSRQGLALAVLGVGLAAVPALSAPSSAADPQWGQRMKSEASGQAQVAEQAATGRVGFVRTDGDLLPGVDVPANAQGAAAKVRAYLDEYAGAFGATRGQLAQADVRSNATGWTVEYTQAYQGVPVFAAELKARVDKGGDLTSVNGFVAPDLDLSVKPRRSAADAAAQALAMVEEAPSGHDAHAPTDGEHAVDTSGLRVAKNDLMVYRMGSTRGIDGPAKLAHVVEVTNDATVRETVILDAHTGKTLNRWSMMAHALDRELYEAYLDDNGTPKKPDDDFVGGLDTPVWNEGDAFPAALDADQQNEVLGTSEAYWLFKNTFGRDSYDGLGSKMVTVNNDPRISCPNANWNGVTTNYCSGVTGDDTVAHEWGHAYTEHTSGLIYQWQSGAMNEAYSDIWGEVVDMLNTRHNEGGENPGDTVLREPDKCSVHQPAAYELGVSITAPAGIAGPCTAAPAAFGPEIQGSQSVSLVVAQDAADNAGPSTTDGCSAYTNGAAVSGNWVFVDRGTCTFQAKVDIATAAGAAGIVVGNNQPTLVSMSGTSTIPGFMVAQEDGTRIKSVVGPVTMSVERLSDPRATDQTHRWLSGESDPAFGGAIRDMWNPTCFGDPGKVSDEEYHCEADDAGGVHTNSGVVNRTFAILVDGSSTEGVAAIGMDKAAHLFWRAQSEYLTPSSFFPDLANALEQSCIDLKGQQLNALTLGDPTDADGSDGAATPALVAGPTDADCAAVSAAIAATELRLDPTATCDWQPILQQGAPQLSCGEGSSVVTTFSEDFEDGLAGWTQESTMVYGAADIPWQAATTAPGGHTSGVAFGPDPLHGSCAQDAEDISSASGLVSPVMTVPAGKTPRLSFEHYVATEANWDGANVKWKTGRGDWTVVPAEAYLFNAPAGHLETAASGNDSPLAGEIAWTGTDGGKLEGSWGTSVIDLSQVAPAGTAVQIKFDLGRDGCNGIDGWYVDNVTVQVCDVPVLPAPSVTAPDVTMTSGTPGSVRVIVDGGGIPVTGTVSVLEGSTVVGTADVVDGVATVTLPGDLAVGRHTMTAAYSGSDSLAAAEDAFTVRVTRPRRVG